MYPVMSGRPSIQNLSMPVANTELTINIPAQIKKILIQARGTHDLKIAFTATESGTNYFTLKASAVYYEDTIHGPFTIALQSPDSGVVVEVVTWLHYD